MSDDDFAWGAPAFRPAQALLQLKRTLRDLRALTERGEAYELKGAPVLTLAVIWTEGDEPVIAAQLARRPMRGSPPEWDAFRLAHSADVRKFADEVKKRLARWTEEDR